MGGYDSDDESSDGEEESEEEKLASFLSRLAVDRLAVYHLAVDRLAVDRLAEYAFDIRKTMHPEEDLQLPEIGPTIFGRKHISFPLTFHDGASWLLKVPFGGNAHTYDEYSARAVRAEARTMQMLRRETTIPIPEVYAFSDTCDNKLNSPFIFLQHVKGKPAYHVWHDEKASDEALRAQRTRILQDVAAAFVQLDKFSFDQGGSLVFDGEDSEPDIDVYSAPINPCPCHSQPDDDELADMDGFGPISDTKEYFTIVGDWRMERSLSTLLTGEMDFLKMLVDQIPEPNDGRKPFVLDNRHLGLWSMIVSDDGAVQAFPYWSEPVAVPRCIGNERYPRWLMCDRDIPQFGPEENVIGWQPGRTWTDSAEELKFYRSVYAEFMRSHRSSPSEDLPAQPDLTTNSLICQSIYEAATDMACNCFIGDVFNEIKHNVRDQLTPKDVYSDDEESEDEENETENENSEKAEDEKDEDIDRKRRCRGLPIKFEFWSVIMALEEGCLPKRYNDLIRAGFDAVLQKSHTL
ncbi:hypothetical protein BO70DRAFT_385684 [Aspergillus heteromorphus CBS 117.55]|uniref:Aminoglycoside phosphotransferase domain-containing protein n=1 Tax=Aspergillus heteromorphus CBS 117.55 TaxID=1448321 RepID=A0A317WTD4_9EURO|nr:uncharacterized protein BO70DRAFT_385684 [Aspergillus heteromorphus CBS 117.55]PWY88542.1 hypothetical protein BO70DRAFT_385684 [Aspergillus heteromorphus CBS 117.55]